MSATEEESAASSEYRALTSLVDVSVLENAFRTSTFHHFPGSTPTNGNPPSQLFRYEDLDAALANEALRIPYFRLFKEGARVHEEEFRRTFRVQQEVLSDGVEPETVQSFLERGATLLCSGLNHYHSAVRAVCYDLSTLFATRVDASGFLTAPFGQGFAAHIDPIDALIVQLEGRKEWTIWSPPDQRPIEGSDFDSDPPEQPLAKLVLQQGDILFVPHGFPHVARCTTEPSLHISFSINVRRTSQLLSEIVRSLLLDDAQLNHFPLLTDNTDAEAALRDGWSRLQQLVEEHDPLKSLEDIVRDGRAQWNVPASTRARLRDVLPRR